MGKAITLLAAGSGTTVVSVGGFYMVQNGLVGEGQGAESVDQKTAKQEGETGIPSTSGSTKEGEKSTTPETVQSEGKSKTQEDAGSDSPSGAGTHETSESDTDEEFSALEKFKTNKGYKCSSSDAPFSDNLDLKGSRNATGESIPSDFLDTAPSSSSDKTKSCLIIDLEKKTYSDDKGLGKFTGTGSFMNDNKGFIVVNIVDTHDSSKLNLVGGAYLLEQKPEGNGEVKYKQEGTTDVATNIDDFEKKLPKAKEGSGVTVAGKSNGNYGGFIKDADDLKNICDVDAGDSCSDSKTTTNVKEEFKGTGKKDGDKNVSDGSDSLNWWNEMYKSDTFDLEKNLENFQGTGSKVSNSTPSV